MLQSEIGHKTQQTPHDFETLLFSESACRPLGAGFTVLLFFQLGLDDVFLAPFHRNG